MRRSIVGSFLVALLFFAYYLSPALIARADTKNETVSVSATVGTFLSLQPESTGSGSSSTPVESIATFHGTGYPGGTVVVHQVGGASVTVIVDQQGVFAGSIAVVPGKSSQIVFTAYDAQGVEISSQSFELMFPKGYVTTIDRVTLTPTSSPEDATIAQEQVSAVSIAQPGDCSADGVLNEKDFVMLQYWHGQRTVPTCGDLNSDGVINLQDFSLLAYRWKK